jgi:Flp pilus assembly protein TadD
MSDADAVTGRASDAGVAPDRPPTAKTLYTMADMLAKQGRDSDCEFLLRRLISEYPEYSASYDALARLQMRKRLTTGAVRTLQRGLEVNPSDPVLLNNLGVCMLVRRDYGKALELFTVAAGIDAENTRYRANAAVALGLLGRYDESLALFRQVLPEEKALHNLEVVRRAREDVIEQLVTNTAGETANGSSRVAE